MKPINIGGHSAYQDRVLTQLRKYYPNAATSLSFSTWQILDKFWNLDLSQVDVLMQDRYSVFGPEPRLPSDMLRSILVSVAFKITSYTKLASDLKENHLHAIISGFYVDDTPGIGTFYDFHRRLWLSSDKNLTNAVHHLRKSLRNRKEKKKKLLLSKNLPLMIYSGSLKKIRLMIWSPAQSFGKFSILFFFRTLPGLVSSR